MSHASVKELGKLVRAAIDKWAKVVKDSGARAPTERRPVAYRAMMEVS